MALRILFVVFLPIFLTACKSTLTVDIEGTGSIVSADGTLACPDSCTREIFDVETITLTANNIAGNYLFHHWEGACEGTEPICVLNTNPIVNFDVKAQFRYTGKTLGDIEFPDNNLRECIFEQYPEYHSTSMISLFCSHRNIISLQGLDEIDSLVFKLILNNNDIIDVTPLTNLNVIQFAIHNNNIVDPLPLSRIIALSRSIQLVGNDNLDCDKTRQLRALHSNLAVRAPQCPLNYGDNDDGLIIGTSVN